MGQPMFQIRDLCRQNNVAVFSSNYALYGDMSRRMNSVYERFSPDIEIYPIDESFLNVEHLPVRDRTEWAADLRATTRQWTGIPCSVGIGPTKTLAKTANKASKKLPGSVLDLTDPAEQTRVMAHFPIGDVWGIGPASQGKLAALGIQFAGQLRNMDPQAGTAVDDGSRREDHPPAQRHPLHRPRGRGAAASGLRGHEKLRSACHHEGRDGAGRRRLCYPSGREAVPARAGHGPRDRLHAHQPVQWRRAPA